MIDGNQDSDLGFDVSGGQSLFEQFHKNQNANEEPKSIEINNPAAKPTDPEQPGATTTKDTSDKSTDKSSDVDYAEILEMSRKQALNLDSDADSSTEKKDKNTANTPVVPEGTFATLYSHFTDTLGYEALTEEEGGFDGSEERFIEFQEKNLQLRAQAEAEGMISETFANQKQNEPMAKDFFRFLANGGNVEDFIATRQDEDINVEYLATAADDDEKEIRSEKVMRKYYKSIGWDEAAIEKTIAPLKAGGSLSIMAESTLPQFIKLKENRKAIADRNVENQKLASQAEIKEYNTKLFQLIDETKQVGAFDLSTPAKRQKVKEYMYVPSVEVNGNKVPPYLAALAEAKKNPMFTLHQALSLMNNGIDYSKIGEKAEQKATQSLKEKLEAAASSKKIEQPVGNSGNMNNSQRANTRDLLDFDNIQFA